MFPRNLWITKRLIDARQRIKQIFIICIQLTNSSFPPLVFAHYLLGEKVCIFARADVKRMFHSSSISFFSYRIIRFVAQSFIAFISFL